MKRVLHVLTHSDDALARSVITQHENTPGLEVKVIELDHASADYPTLVAMMFDSDSVQVW